MVHTNVRSRLIRSLTVETGRAPTEAEIAIAMVRTKQARAKKRKLPYRRATGLIVTWAEKKGTVRFRGRGDSVCFGRRSGSTNKVLRDDEGSILSAEDVLNEAMEDVKELQNLMDRNAPLFRKVVCGLKNKRMESWGFKEWRAWMGE